MFQSLTARALPLSRAVLLTLTVLAAALGISRSTEVAAQAGVAVTSFTLVNADTDQVIRNLSPIDALQLRELPTQNLNIVANTTGTVSRVEFTLSGSSSSSVTRTERVAPYALWGDTNGNYAPWTPSAGTYTLVAVPYDANGNPGTQLKVNFSVYQ